MAASPTLAVEPLGYGVASAPSLTWGPAEAGSVSATQHVRHRLLAAAAAGSTADIRSALVSGSLGEAGDSELRPEAAASEAHRLPSPLRVEFEPSEEAALRPLFGTLAALMGTAGLVCLLRLWRLPKGSPLELPGAGAGALALAAAALLLQPVGASAALAFGGIGPESAAGPHRQALIMLGAILAQLPVIFIVLRADWRGAGRSSRTRALLLGGGAALLAMPAVAGVAGLASRLQERFTGRTFDPIAHETLRMIVEEPGGWSALLSALAITGAPLAEEVLYRGLGHDLLRRLGLAPWSIIGAVSILFALAHWSVATGPALAGLFVLGLALGWSRERSGSLLAPIIGHALFNAVNLWLAGS